MIRFSVKTWKFFLRDLEDEAFSQFLELVEEERKERARMNGFVESGPNTFRQSQRKIKLRRSGV
jgi:hypothetical protein